MTECYFTINEPFPMPRGVWDMPPGFENADGTMRCQLDTGTSGGIYVRYGPIGFQKTMVRHNRDGDCRACRAFLFKLMYGFLLGMTQYVDFDGFLRVEVTPDGEMQIVQQGG